MGVRTFLASLGEALAGGLCACRSNVSRRRHRVGSRGGANSDFTGMLRRPDDDCRIKLGRDSDGCVSPDVQGDASAQSLALVRRLAALQRSKRPTTARSQPLLIDPDTTVAGEAQRLFARRRGGRCWFSHPILPSNRLPRSRLAQKRPRNSRGLYAGLQPCSLKNRPCEIFVVVKASTLSTLSLRNRHRQQGLSNSKNCNNRNQNELRMVKRLIFLCQVTA